MLNVERTPALLISVGAAICGGSAIAAFGPVVGANEEEMSVLLGAVFILNSIALLIFPPIGHSLSLSQEQFGLWSALAIHDTSSVVGATAKYGAAALAVGATVKLTRALWIAPLAVGTAFVKRREARIQWPWFILFFYVAATIRTWIPAGKEAFDTIRNRAHRADGHPVSDRLRDFEKDVTDRWRAAAGSGRDSLGDRRRAVAGADSGWVDRALIRRRLNRRQAEPYTPHDSHSTKMNR